MYERWLTIKVLFTTKSLLFANVLIIYSKMSYLKIIIDYLKPQILTSNKFSLLNLHICINVFKIYDIDSLIHDKKRIFFQ